MPIMRTTSLFRIAAAFVLSTSAVIATAAPPKAQSTFELGDFGGRLRSIRLSVNGHEGTFTIDTAGGVSLLSPEFAKKIGCAPWASHTGFRLTGERIDMPRCDGVTFQLPDGRKLTKVSAGVIDLRPLLFKGAPHADGSIALDAFEGNMFTLDVGNGVLTMHKPGEAAPKGATPVPIRLARQAGGHALGVMVPVATPKGDLWMALDTGGGPPVLMRDNVAATAGLDPKTSALQPYTLNVHGAQPVTLPTKAIVRDMILDGVIGMPVLVRWKVTFDLAKNKLWIASSR